MRTLKGLLADYYKHKEIVHQLDLIGSFIQANVKHRVLVKLGSRYGGYFPEYANYFGRLFILKKSMYGMNHSGNLFSDELTNLLIYRAGLNQSQYQMPIYYKYTLDGSNLILLSYVDECVHLYTYEELGKWFMDTLGKIFHVKFLLYAN